MVNAPTLTNTVCPATVPLACHALTLTFHLVNALLQPALFPTVFNMLQTMSALDVPGDIV